MFDQRIRTAQDNDPNVLLKQLIGIAVNYGRLIGARYIVGQQRLMLEDKSPEAIAIWPLALPCNWSRSFALGVHK